ARGIGAATVDRITEIIYERKIPAWQALELVATDEALLGAGPRKKVAAFVALMTRLRSEGLGLGPASLAEKVLEESGYRDALATEATMEAEGRIENLLELVAQMREYEREAEEPTLHGFLERIALVSDVDGYDPDKGAISLMTVHTAKGLEFPVVFITGLEERIFPHARSVDDDSAVEEERRLCYVAVTRARTQLYLSRVRRRRLSGQELPGVPSRFLRDLPAGCVEAIVMARPPEYGGSYGDSEGRGPWGGRWSREEPEAPRSRLPMPAPRRGAPGARAQAQTPGEIRIEYDDDQSSGVGLQVGAKLRHPSFGVGEVRGWQGAGADLKVTMRFAGVGVKTILARFLARP
ncbi:MAG TPA: 3'-5' exonuclease, partial [Polyangia bacterium]